MIDKGLTSVARVFRVDSHRRIEFEAGLIEPLVGRLKHGSSLTILGVAREHEQLQLVTTDSEIGRMRGRIVGSGDALETPEASGPDDRAELFRQLGAVQELTIRRRSKGNNVRITLPADVFNLGYLRDRDWVVLFHVRQIFEIWPADKWRATTRILDLREIIERGEALSQ